MYACVEYIYMYVDIIVIYLHINIYIYIYIYVWGWVPVRVPPLNMVRPLSWATPASEICKKYMYVHAYAAFVQHARKNTEHQ